MQITSELISAAARAQELYNLDDLEVYAENWRRRQQQQEGADRCTPASNAAEK